MPNKRLKVVHIPFSVRNPYQKLLSEGLTREGLTIKGSKVHHVFDISFLNLSLFKLIFDYWKPDIIHLHWQSSFLNVEGSRLKTIVKSLLFLFQIWVIKQIGIKLVWTVHNLKRHEKTFRALEARFTEKLANRSNRVIVHCQNAAKEMQRKFRTIRENQISIIPHGHFSEYYANNLTTEAARKKLNIDASKLTFLFLGELRYYKGIFDLIETFKFLNDPRLQLIIAGRPHNHNIAREISQKVKAVTNIRTNLNYVSDDDMQVYINASDIMVFPYRDIFTSGGIFLGISFGKPIIAPKSGCITDTLGETNNFLYDPHSKNGLLKAIKASVASAHRLHEIGQENILLSAEHDWKFIAQQTIQLYRAVVSDRKFEAGN